MKLGTMATSNQTAPGIVQELVKTYLDGRTDAIWKHAQSGQWLIKHRDLEIVAAKAGIEFEPPTVLEADAGRSIALVVTGRLDKRLEWSIGEASPKNTQQAYPYAMAEKRAKDRVILKLMHVHGHVYSDTEMAEAEPAKPQQRPSRATEAPKPAQEGPSCDECLQWLRDCTSLEMLKTAWADVQSAGFADDAEVWSLKEELKEKLKR